ncbi:MAG: glycosyltransferase [Armatimonadetes bacterium]|nr:glycosyltransferase [Armatimonadota bacterium]NIM76912.1 glycosyltransferase [Armatimonadota bacterium]NIN06724.1 glycosyltransferase [Armatimonadota bacterium]NIT32072.1 glycosyltransferase [Armatimonadota bacterium]
MVIVNFKARDFLRSCLRSFFAEAQGLETEVFVVDNASHDGSLEMVEGEFPAVHLIEARENLGFSRANNLALRKCSGEKVLLLNPDTEIQPGALQEMAAFLDSHFEAGAVGPRLVDENGKEQPSGRPFPTPWGWFLMQTGIDARFARNEISKEGGDPQQMSGGEAVDWISGACLMLRKDALQNVGLLDERFRLYSEEVDLCYRLKQAGLEVYYLPTAEVVHYGSISAAASQGKDFSRGLLYSSYLTSKLAFFRKHYGFWQAFLARCLMFLAFGYSLAKLPFSILCRRRGSNWYRQELRLALIGLCTILCRSQVMPKETKDSQPDKDAAQ